MVTVLTVFCNIIIKYNNYSNKKMANKKYSKKPITGRYMPIASDEYPNNGQNPIPIPITKKSDDQLYQKP